MLRPKSVPAFPARKTILLTTLGLCLSTTLFARRAHASSSKGGSVVRAEVSLRSGHNLSVRLGDITREDTEAIVNPANSKLNHGGGLAGAIVRSGGWEIQEESDKFIQKNGKMNNGDVAVTSAGKLKARFVIHAVGPVWHDGTVNERRDLRLAVWNSLLAAKKLGVSSIAIPAISSGIFGFPKEECAKIVIETTRDYCDKHPQQPPRDIHFTNFDEPTVSVFEREFQRQFPETSEPKKEL